MAPHIQRVVDEMNELDRKRAALRTFIERNPVFATLDQGEQDRLREQSTVMERYSDILSARITAALNRSLQA